MLIKVLLIKGVLLLHHIVLFTLKDPAQAPLVVARLQSMRGQIPALVSLRCGVKSVDKPAASDVVLITEHADAQGLAEYASDPLHAQVLEWLAPMTAARAVIDTDNLG